MKKIKSTIAVVLAVISLSSCGGGAVDMAKKINSSYEYDGKTITLTGKLESDRMVWGGVEERKSIRMNLRVQSAMDNTNSERISDLQMTYGEGKNSVKLN